ncbi:MAG: terminase small subunit [Giesbergeria sp.]|nr:terminase small subunit [Giesbergeria sp.]
MKTRKDQLTPRQQAFCALYVGAARRNAALAARMAGYAESSSHVTGCQLLQKPKVAATVRALEAVNAQDMNVTRQDVLARLLEAAALAKQQAQPSAMVAAWRAIAQAAGLYGPQKAPRAAQRAETSVRDELERMSDAQLRAMMAAGG